MIAQTVIDDLHGFLENLCVGIVVVASDNAPLKQSFFPAFYCSLFPSSTVRTKPDQHDYSARDYHPIWAVHEMTTTPDEMSSHDIPSFWTSNIEVLHMSPKA
jgi:hypothetical protein